MGDARLIFARWFYAAKAKELFVLFAVIFNCYAFLERRNPFGRIHSSVMPVET